MVETPTEMLTADTQTRAVLINNLVQYCLDYDFEGVVLDWEPMDVNNTTDRNR